MSSPTIRVWSFWIWRGFNFQTLNRSRCLYSFACGLAWFWMFTGLAMTTFTGLASAQSTQLKGRVIDAISHDPVAFAYLHLEEINRTALTDSDGGFLFSSLPQGTFTLAIHRIGYKDAHWQITIRPDQMDELLLSIYPEVLQGEEVTVNSESMTSGGSIEGVSRKVTGNELRASLGSTLAETMRLKPGMDQRSMGGAPARPIIRGLGGERVVILKDGTQSGDISAQSADHAVSMDPITADEIEIARGATALLYSSNAVGGVVNVVQNLIPTTIPRRITGIISLQGKSADESQAGAVKLYVPLRNWSLHTDWSGRSGGNLKTPLGTLQNSKFSTRTGIVGGGGRVFGSDIAGVLRAALPSVGLSLIRPWGYAGISSSLYSSQYGIPPDPNGGHPDGVNIEMQKWQVNSRSERILNHAFWTLAEGRMSYTQYQHKEIESSGFIGTEFGQVVLDSKVQLRHKPLSNRWEDGIMGFSAGYKNYAVRGAGTPDSEAFSLAFFSVEKMTIQKLDVEIGFRAGLDLLRPEQQNPDSRIGFIRNRKFITLASALTTTWNITQRSSLGATFMKTVRAPGFEELYSEGPHLAAYSFEIGNPDLNQESGWSAEGFARTRSDRLETEFTVYSIWFSDYLHARNTGRINFRYPSLFDYQFSSTQAWIRGAEWVTTLKLSRSLTLLAHGALTHGDRKSENSDELIPLPMIPPASGSLGLSWKNHGWTLETGLEAKATQSRLGEFETRTPAYQVWNGSAQYQFMARGKLHTFILRAQNITDRIVYSHLSRIKDISPESGRDLAFLYRIYF